MPLGDDLLNDASAAEIVKNISHLTIPYNINDLCRVCLLPITSKKTSNLFFASGRSIQLWAKLMACAWVQVFEGDGLPSHICYKCHNKLDIAYQFKQQCEAADSHIRQFLNRANGNKAATNHIDLTQTQPECLSDCKPLNYNISSVLTDIDLSLSTYRLETHQDITSQQLDFRPRDSNDFASMKQEPGFINNLNAINSLSLQKSCQVNSAFKCESFNDSDIILDSLPAKLFESIDETINQDSVEAADQLDTKLVAWDLQHKNQSSLLKNDFLFDSNDKENTKNKENSSSNNDVDMTFLTDDRSVSPLESNNMLSEACSDSSTMDIDNECSFANTDGKQLSAITITNDEHIKGELKPEEKPIQPIVTKKARKKKAKNVKQPKSKDEKKAKKKEPQQQCELCGKVFTYRNYMVQHLRTHTGVKPFSCTHCDQKFSLYRSLVTHLRTHSGDRPYICSVCGKGFTQSVGLKFHMRAHTGEKPYECEVCSKKFSQKSNLFIHKQIHSGQRDHVCTVCFKAFKFYKHLQSHMALHSDEKKYKCSVCSKSFHRKSYLHIHLSIHSGERPFKCNVCEHAFSNSSNLRAHSRIHSGIKPYKCKVCLKEFSQSSALNRHMQHHAVK